MKPAGGPAFTSKPGSAKARAIAKREQEDQANKAIQSAISASCGATRSCPTCRSKGTILVKMQVPHKDYRYGKITYREVEEPRQCGTCHGRGFLAASLPPGADVDIAKIDSVGLERKLLDWRPIQKVGTIRGLPRFSGMAFATNGILVAIRRDNGEVVFGHYDSFVAVEPKATPKAIVGRKSKLQKLMEEFA